MGEGKTVDHWDEWTTRMQEKHGNGNGHGKSLAIEALRLLPTPDAYAGARGGSQHPDKKRAGGHMVTLQDVTEHALLGTPTAQMSIRSEEFARPGETPAEFASRYDGTWGDYSAAIAHWEHTLGRPAPNPTEPNGQHRPRLSANFVEWMMGLPEGWVTDTPGITRNEALKALGNGVVPQQGAVAIRHLLDLMEGQTE